MNVILKPYERHQQRCYIYCCNNKAEFVITKENAPVSAEIKICRQCAKGICKDGNKIFKKDKT